MTSLSLYTGVAATIDSTCKSRASEPAQPATPVTGVALLVLARESVLGAENDADGMSAPALRVRVRHSSPITARHSDGDASCSSSSLSPLSSDAFHRANDLPTARRSPTATATSPMLRGWKALYFGPGNIFTAAPAGAITRAEARRRLWIVAPTPSAKDVRLRRRRRCLAAGRGKRCRSRPRSSRA